MAVAGIGWGVYSLRGLSATRAAVLQLLVPIIAAGGGMVLLDERATLRLGLAGGAIPIGVLLAIRGRS